MFKVNYDDQVYDAAYSAINEANKLLTTHGLQLEINDDGLEHDGWMQYTVTLKNIKGN